VVSSVIEFDIFGLFSLELFDRVHKTKSQNLQRWILDEAAFIPNEYIEDAVSDFYHRAHCLNDEQFEHLIIALSSRFHLSSCLGWLDTP